MAKKSAKKKPDHLERISITFIEPFDRYNAGDVAGFFLARATELIDGGVALYTNKDDMKKANSLKTRLTAKVAGKKSGKVAPNKEDADSDEEEDVNAVPNSTRSII